MVSGPSGINTDLATSSGASGAERVAGAGLETGSSLEPQVQPAVDAGAAEWLPAVLDTLLPANDHIPAAGQMGLIDSVLQDAQWAPELTDSVNWLGTALPGGFAAAPMDERVSILQGLESQDPRLFGGIVNLAYNAYYTDPRVLSLIEEKSTFTATPPQPNGYAMDPFDPAVLSTIREREPFWRKA